LPDETDPNYDEINREKNNKVQEKAERGNFNFEGARLPYVDFDGLVDSGGKKIEFRNLNFDDARIYGDASFNDDTIYVNAWFHSAIIRGNVYFERTVIKGDAVFDYAVIDGNRFACNSTEILGELSFEHAKIKHVKAQEEAYRKAKQVWEKLGDRKRADDYFYREMEAKREQKNEPIKTLECIIQYGVGYGVHYEWLLVWWVVVAVIIGLALSIVNSSALQNFIFGFAAAFVPGYGISSHFQSNVSECIGCIGAIFSTFFWAAFILVFARKYMR
jgi:hypothetical protein